MNHTECVSGDAVSDTVHMNTHTPADKTTKELVNT